MRYGKIIICLFTAVFLAAALYVRSLEPEPELKTEIPFSVLVRSGEETEKINCWESPAGECYVFLPSYASLSDVSVRLDKGAFAAIDGQPVADGGSCASLQWDTPYSFSWATGTESRDTTLTFLPSGNVPTMYVDVLSGNMDYIHAEKGNREPGQLRLYSDGGELEYAGHVAGLSGRGNTTWLYEKKPYNLSLSYEADLLGMGTAQNWILLANACDESNLRSKIVYDFSGEIGMAYSPKCQWVDLYLNGAYAGLYLLTTRNEIHPQRVAISQTDSFLVSMELEWRMEMQDLPYISTGNSDWLVYRIQDSSVDPSDMQAMLQSAENAILAEDGIDPETGMSYLELIDLDSWAYRYLIDEVFGNFDGGSLSQFFYYDGSSGSEKLCAGPVWDMDNCLSLGGYPANSIWAGRPHLWDSEDRPLFYALWRKEAFRQRVLELYETEFRPAVEPLLRNQIDEYKTQIQQAARVNALRWDMADISEQAAYIRGHLESRMAFLDDYFYGDTDYHLVQEADPGGVWRCFAVADGESLSWSYYYMDTEDGRYLGYCDAETGEPFDVEQPVYSDITIRPKWESWESPGEEPAESGQAEGMSYSIPAWTFLPLAGLLGMLVILLLTDWIRSRRNGGGSRGRASSREVPSRTEI